MTSYIPERTRPRYYVFRVYCASIQITGRPLGVGITGNRSRGKAGFSFIGQSSRRRTRTNWHKRSCIRLPMIVWSSYRPKRRFGLRKFYLLLNQKTNLSQTTMVMSTLVVQANSSCLTLPLVWPDHWPSGIPSWRNPNPPYNLH